MARTIAYCVSLALFLSATVLTSTSIFLPTWITTGPQSLTPRIDQGLRTLCTGNSCAPFPTPHMCDTSALYSTTSLPAFCTLWRTASYLILLALFTELVTLLTFLIILAPITGALSGDVKSRQGWKVLLPLMALVVAFEVAAVSITGYVYDKDEAYFSPYWRLGSAWGCAMGSWVVVLLTGMGLGAWMYVLGRREKQGVEGRGDVFDSLLRGAEQSGATEDGERGLSYGT